MPAHPSTVPKFGNASLFSGSRYVAAVFFALFILDTRKRVYVFTYADLVVHSIFLQLLFDILLDYLFISSYRCNLSLWTLTAKGQERA